MSRLFRLSLLFCFCATVARADLVGYWTFDDDTCEDSSGNAYDGTMNGGSYSADVPAALAGGKSIDLTAGAHYVIIDSIAFGAASDPFDLGSSFTVSCWIKGWPGDWEPFVSKNGEQGGWQLRKYSAAANLGWTTRGTGTADLQGTGNASVAGWHHIAATYDGVYKRIYLDGVLDRSVEATGTVSARDERVVFGAREQVTEGTIGGHAQVMMDDVAVFDEVLGLSRIRALSQGTAADDLDDVNPLIGYWTFDGDNIDDSHIFGFDGVLYGGTYSADVPTALGGGKSLDLRGGDNCARIDAIANNPPADPFDLPNLTVSFWVKGWPDADSDTFVNKRAGGWGWSVMRQGTSIKFGTWDNAPNEVTGGMTGLDDSNWHHVCCTDDGAIKRIYVDGRLDTSVPASGPRDHGNERLCFGARETGDGVRSLYSSIQMDDIAVFDRALTGSQVRFLAQGGAATSLPAASAGLDIYDFEDGTMQGWRNILVSRLVNVGQDSFPSEGDQTEEFVADNKVSTPHGSYQSEQRRTHMTNFNELDGRHSTHLARSPRFKLDDSGDLTLWLSGGKGPDTSIANEDSILGLADASGTMRAYLRRDSDGVYLEELRRSGNGNTLELRTLTAATLAPYVSGTETYTVDVVDCYYGGWGWIAFDDVTIPGTPAPEAFNRVIQFDVCQQRGTYLGTQSPAHAVGAATASDKYWNGAGVDLTGSDLFYANGGAATGISIDFGLTTDGLGVADVDWGQSLSASRTDTAGGVLDTYLMKDWTYSTGNNNLGVRISGFDNGVYQVFALVREPNQLGRTYDVYMGLNINKPGDPGARQLTVGAASGSTWTEGETYAQTTLNVNSTSDYITIIVDPTNAAYATLGGIQIVNVTQVGTVFNLR